MIWTERTTLAHHLWSYGEDDLWKRPLMCRGATMTRIGELAEQHLFDGPNASQAEAALLSRGLASAAVEVFEGAPRPLRRKRRRPDKEFPGYPRLRTLVARYWFDRHATHARRVVARNAGRRPV
jgi:hypothetical protein